MGLEQFRFEGCVEKMSVITLNGGKRLSGKIKLHGAKNSVLPILAATALCDGVSVIHNCPDLSDVNAAISILEHLGAKIKREGETLTVNSTAINSFEIPDELMRRMRSSIVFLGAMISRSGKATLSSPGGCELGPRPIDLHLASLKELGVTISENHGFLECNAENGLVGSEISLAFPSVGATENIILTAVKAKGKTVIHNAAKEPEISDLADFLNSAGANIQGAGSDTVEIYGVKKIVSAEHRVISDRIEASTYLSAAAVTGGKITLINTVPAHLTPVLSVFKNAGCDFSVTSNTVTLSAPTRIKRVPVIRTLPYPGFPTDAGSAVIAMLCLADGTSMFVESIFENRYKFVDEIKRLGAVINTNGRVAVIEGVKKLSGASVMCTDLRGGAALVVAGLAAYGETVIDKTEHIDRGYQDLVENFALLGADIKRSKEWEENIPQKTHENPIRNFEEKV